MCNYVRSLFIVLVAIVMVGCATTQPHPLDYATFSDMVHLQRDSHSARVSSFDPTGGNTDWRIIMPGDTLELANIDGAGCIRHIYFTLNGPKHYLRDLVLRMYWDGEENPSVETPLGDFFGLGHERVVFFRTQMVTVNEGASGISSTLGLNAYFPMPFGDGARLTLANEGPDPVGACWYHVNYETFDSLPDDIGRFHAQWRRENPTTAVRLPNGANTEGKENYVILDAKGCGNLAGYFLNVDNIGAGWYGEGDDMIFIDDDTWPPSFHGTGSEEIFGGGACPNVAYTAPYSGYQLIGNPLYDGKASMYRFFVADPVRFQKSIKVTIEHGHADNLANDYTSTAFWYQDEPHAPFVALPPAEERHARVGTDKYDTAYQRLEALNKKIWEVRAAMTKGQRAYLTPDEVLDLLTDQSNHFPRLLQEARYDELMDRLQVWFDRMDEIIEANKTGE